MVPVAWDLWLLSGGPLHEALTRHHPGELLGVHHESTLEIGEYARIQRYYRVILLAQE